MDVLTAMDEGNRYRHEVQQYNSDPENISEPAFPQPADLVAVYHIDPVLYYLTADGNWSETGAYAKPFDECKATFLASEPRHDVFAMDFPTVENNIRTIVDMARGATRPQLKGLYQQVKDGRTLQKFAHKMFVVR